MQLITDDYKKLNEELHASNRAYGTSGHHYLKDVMHLVNRVQSQDILDYGCGKSTLQQNLPFQIKQYDPCVAKYSRNPDAADIVICTDVMEHVEENCIDNVLSDISRLTKKIAFFSIAVLPAIKTLPDGRNAHVSVYPPRWWIDRLYNSFDLISFTGDGRCISVLAKPCEQKIITDSVLIG